MHHMRIIQIPRQILLLPRPPPRPLRTSSNLPSMNFIRQFFSSPSPETMSAAKTKAQTIIDENAVALFSKSYCPHCNASKKLLDSMGAKYFAIELDQVDDGAAIQSALVEISGQRTVPNIYIGQKHIGGNSDLQAKSGELKSLLKEVGAA
ncbi:thioredoxin-like protein [Hypoxylon argillaceum]|nr:thioredoxin-like protein [Hypoxylon argillaceum]KAI1150076.1 thioredoxin-like protein [Nemania diffusa]